MGLYRWIGHFMFGGQYRKFEEACKSPEVHQKKSWERIRHQLSQGTYWSNKVDHFSQRDLEDFPITDYESYREYIASHIDDVYSPFTGEKICIWGESAGTTGKSKVYPITDSYRNEFQKVNGPFLYQVMQNNPSFLKNKTIYFAATHPTRKTKAGIDIGFISAYNYSKIPKLFKRKYALPDVVFSQRDIFFQWGALYALSEKIDTFIAITPSIVERFFQEIVVNKDFYKKQILDPKPPSEFPSIQFSQTDKKRLLAVLDKKDLTLQDLWPDLRTLICWKSSSCGLQLSQLKSVLGSVEVVDAIYSATEGWMTVPFGNSHTSGGALNCSGHVVEFLEVDNELTPRNLLKPWELKIGKKYEVFLTTSMGFIRFRLHDIILCKGMFHHSPIIEFCEKEGQSIPIGHNRVSDEDILKALEISKMSLPKRWFVICANDAKRLVLVVPEGAQIEKIDMIAFDKGLSEANSKYGEDRREGLLEIIVLKTLKESDPLWPQLKHAQSKPKIILQGFIDL